jgi:inner membrane protein
LGVHFSVKRNFPVEGQECSRKDLGTYAIDGAIRKIKIGLGPENSSMDLFSHALLPYLFGSFLRMNKKLLAAFVLGGIAPDLDLLVVWLNDIYPTSLLIVHRGFTHTFFFGFFTALAMLYLVTRGPVLGAVQRFLDFDLDFSMVTLTLAYAGVLSHLLLDYLTTRGVPLLYPLHAARYSAEIFFHTEIIIMIASLAVLAELFRERSRKGFNNKLFIIFIVFIVAIGAIRIEGKDTAQSFFHNESAKSFADSGLFQWAVLDDDHDQFQVYEFDYFRGKVQQSFTFPRLFVKHLGYNPKKAIEAADELSQVKLFRWRAYAVAINASFQNGSWILEYYDPVVKMETMSDWPILQRVTGIYGSIRVKVNGDLAEVIK